MKKFIWLAILSMIFSGCAFIYDSRDQNSLDVADPKSKNLTADNATGRTGRYILYYFLYPRINDQSWEEK
jgi:hypothetical protein